MLKLGKFRLSAAPLAALLAFALLNPTAHTLILFICLLIHECGHIFFIKLRGLKITRIELLPFGVDIKTEGPLASYKTDMITAAGGPVFGLAAALAALIAAKAGLSGDYLMFFFMLNVSYSALNLFPVRGLDGGRICSAALGLILDGEAAARVSGAISIVSLCILGALALLVLAATGYNLSLVLICAYLFYTIYFSPKGSETYEI